MERLPTTVTLSKGFSLIEMLVVLAIVSIISSVVLFGQSSFNRAIALTDTAYTIALSIREVQSLGLASRTFSGSSDVGYGAAFSAGNDTYTIFADTASVAGKLSNCPTVSDSSPEAKPGNCIYDSGNDGIFETYSMQRGFSIFKFCGVTTANATLCSDTGSLDVLSIVSVRPSTDIIMTGTDGGAHMVLKKASIYVEPPDGTVLRGICVSSAGQVSVVAGACP